MKKFQTLAAIILSLALAGCGKEESNRSQNLVGDHITGLVIQNVETSQFEGKIVKVQSSHLSFYGDYFGNQPSVLNHEFIYVIVEGQDRKLHTFIYPYSKAILERDATIKFTPLNSGTIDIETFIDTFIKQNYFTDDDFVIEAEGIIVKDGIRYK